MSDRLIINGLDVTNFKEDDEEFSFEFSVGKRIVEYSLIIKVYDLIASDIMTKMRNGELITQITKIVIKGRTENE